MNTRMMNFFADIKRSLLYGGVLFSMSIIGMVVARFEDKQEPIGVVGFMLHSEPVRFVALCIVMAVVWNFLKGHFRPLVDPVELERIAANRTAKEYYEHRNVEDAGR